VVGGAGGEGGGDEDGREGHWGRRKSVRARRPSRAATAHACSTVRVSDGIGRTPSARRTAGTSSATFCTSEYAPEVAQYTASA
jgi:hypothetical protein